MQENQGSLNHYLHDQIAHDNGQAIFDAQMPKARVSVFNLQSEATGKKTVLHSPSLPSYHPWLETGGASKLWQSHAQHLHQDQRWRDLQMVVS